MMMEIKVMQYDSGDNCSGKNVLFILNDQQEETKSLPKKHSAQLSKDFQCSRQYIFKQKMKTYSPVSILRS